MSWSHLGFFSDYTCGLFFEALQAQDPSLFVWGFLAVCWWWTRSICLTATLYIWKLFIHNYSGYHTFRAQAIRLCLWCEPVIRINESGIEQSLHMHFPLLYRVRWSGHWNGCLFSQPHPKKKCVWTVSELTTWFQFGSYQSRAQNDEIDTVSSV